MFTTVISTQVSQTWINLIQIVAALSVNFYLISWEFWRHLKLVGISLWSLTKFLLPNISINSNWRQARLRHVLAAMLVLQRQLPPPAAGDFPIDLTLLTAFGRSRRCPLLVIKLAAFKPGW
jgi:hypothetical protein